MYLGNGKDNSLNSVIGGHASEDICDILLHKSGNFFLTLRFHGSKIHTKRRKLVFVANGLHKIEHIGIAVACLDESIPLFERLLGSASYKTEEVLSEGVRTAFFCAGDQKIELLEPTTPNSPIARFLEKRGQGIHHIAFEVSDIHSEINRLQAEGFVVLNETPKMGADQKQVVFLHPKSTGGVLIELCQQLPEE